MIQRLLLTGLLSGAVAGVVLTLVHLTMVQPLIAEAEVFEQRASAATPAPKVDPQHSHAAHEHSAAIAQETWSPVDGLERSLFTLAANLLTAIAFGLVLAAGFTLYGSGISIAQGLLWGGAGFLSFSFLPGLGLPAELPASAAGDLLTRQAWWLGTAVASCAGLACIAFGKSIIWRVGGVLLLVIPHAIGAPHPEAGAVGPSPPELAAHFVMVSLFASAVMWGSLGAAAAYVYRRISESQETGLTEPHRT